MLETEKQFIMRWQGVMDLGSCLVGYAPMTQDIVVDFAMKLDINYYSSQKNKLDMICASCLVGYAPMTQDTCCSRFRYETRHKLLFFVKEAITNIYPKYMKEVFENMK